MATIELSESALGGARELALGDQLVLRLSENPTTGYRWQLHVSGDSDVLATLDDRFEPGGARLPPGAAGVRVFRFSSKNRGTAQLQLRHARGWQAEAGSGGEIAIVVR